MNYELTRHSLWSLISISGIRENRREPDLGSVWGGGGQWFGTIPENYQGEWTNALIIVIERRVISPQLLLGIFLSVIGAYLHGCCLTLRQKFEETEKRTWHWMETGRRYSLPIHCDYWTSVLMTFPWRFMNKPQTYRWISVYHCDQMFVIGNYYKLEYN